MAAFRMLKNKSDTVESLEAELEKICVEGAAACAARDAIQTREAQLEDPDAILVDLAKSRSLSNKIARLDREASDCRERLALAKDAARRRRLEELRAAHTDAARRFLAAAKPAMETAAQLTAARDALASEGFGDAFRGTPLPPMLGLGVILAPDLLEIFERAMRFSKPVKPAAVTQVVRRASPPPPQRNSAFSPEIMVGGTFSGDAEKRPQVHTKRKPLREVAGEGERLLLISRGVVEHPRGHTLCQAGDVIALTSGEAIPLIRGGTADYISPAEIAHLNKAYGVAPPQDVTAIDVATNAPERKEAAE